MNWQREADWRVVFYDGGFTTGVVAVVEETDSGLEELREELTAYYCIPSDPRELGGLTAALERDLAVSEQIDYVCHPFAVGYPDVGELDYVTMEVSSRELFGTWTYLIGDVEPSNFEVVEQLGTVNTVDAMAAYRDLFQISTYPEACLILIEGGSATVYRVTKGEDDA